MARMVVPRAMNSSTSPIDNRTESPPPARPAPPPEGSSRPKGDPLRQQQALAALGRRATTGPDMSSLMEDAAALLAEMLDADGSGAARRTPDGESLRLRLTLDEPGKAGAISHEHQAGAGSIDSLAGFALEAAQPLLVADLSQEQRFADRFLRQHSVRSAIAVPLRVQGRPYGVLLACHRAAGAFDEGDLTFAETIAHLVAATIAQQQAEKALAEERRLIEGMLQTVDAMVLVLSPQGRIVRANAACERLTGFRPEEILDRPIWNVLCPAEESGVFQGLRARLSASGSPLTFESSLMTKHAGRRRIAWSCSMVEGDSGTPASIVATGVEVPGVDVGSPGVAVAGVDVAEYHPSDAEPPQVASAESGGSAAFGSRRRGGEPSGRPGRRDDCIRSPAAADQFRATHSAPAGLSL